MLHKTQTGYTDLVDTWTDSGSKIPRANWSLVPGTIITYDGDDHYEAWNFSGRIEDACDVIANFLISDNTYIRRDGKYLIATQIPPDFFDADGEIAAEYKADCVAI